jgi:predicted porin
MNKKLMALAVAGAVAGAVVAPTQAMAQSSNIQIDGSLTFLYYLHDPKNPGGAGKKGDILEDSEPELRISGAEKLGGGLSAWFQCASSFDLWEQSGSGFCTRNSGLGFKGSFGNVFTGAWDTPLKLVYNQARGAFSGTNALYGGTGTLLFGSSASGANNEGNPERFYRRQARTVNYHSPSWGGFNVKGAYSSGTEHTHLGISPLNPRLIGLSGEYSSGPLYVGLGYELHQDYNPGGQAVGAGPLLYNGGDDTNISLVGVWTFGGNIRLSGVISKSEYEVTNTTTTEIEGFGIYLDWKLGGPHSVRFQYGAVDDPGGNSTVSLGRYIAGANTLEGGAKVYGVNYEYAFSKRTAGLVGANFMKNDAGAAFSQGKSAATLGGKQQSMGIAIKHRF